MFTGLVTDLGEVTRVVSRGKGRTLTMRTAYDMSAVELGDSIAHDGVCLTVETKGPGWFTVTAGIETLDCTTLGGWKSGRKVHLEQALRMGDRLGGHIVQGHVDGVGHIRSIERRQESVVVWIEAPAELARYMVGKGSVCVDGVSLTVNEVRASAFRVNLVPHTVDHTHLASGVGEPVNLEVDVLARYVERLLTGDREGLTFDRLRELGYGETT
ncbi:MAG: riboflavin synthase [Proteobacteria bacterium]|nr:riboflavin synthase [Pseudomonadota bacterium]MCP4919430.1 riboflavin synthase [Pseudomonadota bacterium]